MESKIGRKRGKKEKTILESSSIKTEVQIREEMKGESEQEEGAG